MVVEKMTTVEFSNLDLRAKKKIFSKFLNAKVNEVVDGSMTNKKWGLYTVRIDTYAYCKIKVEPTENSLTHLMVWDYQAEEWLEAPTNLKGVL